jgi:GxxExxY protein
MNAQSLLYKEQTYSIIGAALEVYNALGNGFLESVYEEALMIELQLRKIPFAHQVDLPIDYKGTPLTKVFCAEMIAYGHIILELKAIHQLGRNEEAQLLNYLKASHRQLGLLINFGSSDKLEWKRMVLTQTSRQKRITDQTTQLK